VNSPTESAVGADLVSARFLAGAARKQWRVVSYTFPVLIVAVAAVEPDGRASEYAFRLELTGFPGTAPEAQIWDLAANGHLAANLRPKGSQRVTEAFKDWTAPHPVYRPWERTSGQHNNFAQAYPDLAWHPKRDLTFILEELHGLLTANGVARSAG
jgi:hypothetical protein